MAFPSLHKDAFYSLEVLAAAVSLLHIIFVDIRHFSCDKSNSGITPVAIVSVVSNSAISVECLTVPKAAFNSYLLLFICKMAWVPIRFFYVYRLNEVARISRQPSVRGFACLFKMIADLQIDTYLVEECAPVAWWISLVRAEASVFFPFFQFKW